MAELNCFLEYLVEPRILVTIYHQVNVVQLVFYQMRSLKSRSILCQILPIFLLPEKFNPHFVCAWTLITHAAGITVSMKMGNISKLFPFVKNLETLYKQSFPNTQVKFANFVIWSFSRESAVTNLLFNRFFILFCVSPSLLSL